MNIGIYCILNYIFSLTVSLKFENEGGWVIKVSCIKTGYHKLADREGSTLHG
jgi:hypothetical protein